MKNLIITLLFAACFACGCFEKSGVWRLPDEALAWFPHQLGDTLYFADTSGNIQMGRVVKAEKKVFDIETEDYASRERFDAAIGFDNTRANSYRLIECRFDAMYDVSSRDVSWDSEGYEVVYFVKSRDYFQSVIFISSDMEEEYREYHENYEIDGVSVPGVYSYDIAKDFDFATRGARGTHIAKIFAAPGYGLLRVEFWDGYWMERRWE